MMISRRLVRLFSFGVRRCFEDRKFLFVWLNPLLFFVALSLTAFVATVFFMTITADSAMPLETSLVWQPLNEPGMGGRLDSIAVSPYNSDHILAGGDMLGARLSTDWGDRWSATSGWLNYEIADFTWHPEQSERVWAGSLSGPHLSVDGGKTWEVKRTGFPAVNSGRYTAPVEKVLFDPDSDRLLAFGGDHRQLRPEDAVSNYGTVWVSRNQGENWQRLSEIVEGGNIVSASYAGESDSEIYTALWNRGVFYSGDDGVNWTARSNGLPADESGNILISHLSVHPSDSNTLWAAIEDFGIYKTTNAGNNWQLSDQGIPSGGSEFGAIEVGQDGQTLYAGNKNYSDRPGIYKSTDGGSSWRHQFYDENQIEGKQKPYPGGIIPWWIETDPANADTVYTSTDNAIYRSTDGGVSWTILTARPTSSGWQGNGFSGLVARNIEWNPADSEHMVLQGMDSAKAIQSWDGGRSWQVDNSGLPSYSGGHDAAFSLGSIFSVFGQDGSTSDLIARSQDVGRSWTLLAPPTGPSEAKQVHVDPANPNRLWVVIDQQLWYSSNANQTDTPLWTQIDVGFSGNAVGDIEAVPGYAEMFYIATDAGVYITTHGSEFSFVGGTKGAEGVELAVSAAEPDLLYAAKSQSEQVSIQRYRRSENSWASVQNPIPATHIMGGISVHPTNANVLAVVTDDHPYHDENWATGVWLSRDAGETWQAENEGLPMLRGGAISFHPDGQKIVVGLGGAGFYVAPFEQDG